MRSYVGLLLLGALALSAVVSASETGAAKKDDLDKKAVEIVKQLGALYKDAKAFHVEGTITSTGGEGDKKQETKIEVTYDVQRPNLLALRTKSDNDKSPGLEVISDGKTLIASTRRPKQYTQTDAPDSLTELGQQLLQYGPPQVGMLLPNLLIDDPYETLMQGVTECSYAGKEKKNGVDVHHLKFKQAQFDWELFVAADGKPFVMGMNTTGNEPKFSIVETYKDWKIQDSLDKKTFTATPPKDAKKVDNLELGNQAGR